MVCWLARKALAFRVRKPRLSGVMSRSLSRRKFIALSGAAVSMPNISYGSASAKLGQGDFQYRTVPGWGVLGDKTPGKKCHGIVCDAEGNF